MFGLTEEQIAHFGMTFGLSAFMLFMLFIIWDLAKQSKAGRLGTSSTRPNPRSMITKRNSTMMAPA